MTTIGAFETFERPAGIDVKRPLRIAAQTGASHPPSPTACPPMRKLVSLKS